MPRHKLMLLMLLFVMLTAILHKPIEEFKWGHKWGKSVVRILGHHGGGTGFQMEYEGHSFIMTNDHVCELHTELNEVLIDSPWGEIAMEPILFRSPKTDLCIIAPHPQLPSLHLGNADFLPNEGVLILGHPKLDKLTPSYGHAGKQVIMDVMMWVIETQADRDRCNLPKNKIEKMFFDIIEVCNVHLIGQETSALIYPGNSGSPVLDRAGKVRGVAFASDKTNKGSIIPWHEIKEFLDDSYKHLPVPAVHPYNK